MGSIPITRSKKALLLKCFFYFTPLHGESPQLIKTDGGDYSPPPYFYPILVLATTVVAVVTGIAVVFTAATVIVQKKNDNYGDDDYPPPVVIATKKHPSVTPFDGPFLLTVNIII